jgi:hypothetical protein
VHEGRVIHEDRGVEGDGERGSGKRVGREDSGSTRVTVSVAVANVWEGKTVGARVPEGEVRGCELGDEVQGRQRSKGHRRLAVPGAADANVVGNSGFGAKGFAKTFDVVAGAAPAQQRADTRWMATP